MTRFFVCATLVVAILCGAPLPSANAACSKQEKVRYVNGFAVTTLVWVCPGDQSDETAPSSAAETPDLGSTLNGTGACSIAALLLDQGSEFCAGSNESPALTPPMVASALRRVPIPAANLLIQPVNGRTFVNFDTNFYTERDEFTRAVNLLGRRVELRIWPARFTWRFGDGETLSTTSPGSAYPRLEITHSYRKADPVSPSVDTTYEAQFRVGEGAWRPVPGTVTIAGDTVPLDVLEATPTLVRYD